MHFPDRQGGPSFAEVKQQANGKWPDILATLGVPVSANGKHGPCPGCGGKDRFRFDNKDGDGTAQLGMFWRVNGAAIFSKGANMIPMEELEGRMSDEAHRVLVQNAAEGGMNTLRVWGYDVQNLR